MLPSCHHDTALQFAALSLMTRSLVQYFLTQLCRWLHRWILICVLGIFSFARKWRHILCGSPTNAECIHFNHVYLIDTYFIFVEKYVRTLNFFFEKYPRMLTYYILACAYRCILEPYFKLKTERENLNPKPVQTSPNFLCMPVAVARSCSVGVVISSVSYFRVTAHFPQCWRLCSVFDSLTPLLRGNWLRPLIRRRAQRLDESIVQGGGGVCDVPLPCLA